MSATPPDGIHPHPTPSEDYKFQVQENMFSVEGWQIVLDYGCMQNYRNSRATLMEKK